LRRLLTLKFACADAINRGLDVRDYYVARDTDYVFALVRLE
jgi:hypothetical protein